MDVTYDALIVGGGPAGLSDALVLGRCRRRVLVCSTGAHRNESSADVHALLGHEGMPPLELLGLASRELEKYSSIERRDAAVTAISPTGLAFTFECLDGFSGSAHKILLATGLVDELPPIDGVEALYGRSVHHCLYCDGYEHRDQPLAAYGAGGKGAGIALMMKQWASDVILCTNAQAAPDAEMTARLAQHGIAVRQDSIVALEGRSGHLDAIRFRDGTTLKRSALFFSTGCKQRSGLWSQLGCTRDAKGGIVINPDTEETTVPGVYVAGDISLDVLLVAVAVGEGAKAGVAINRALSKRDGLL